MMIIIALYSSFEFHTIKLFIRNFQKPQYKTVQRFQTYHVRQFHSSFGLLKTYPFQFCLLIYYIMLAVSFAAVPKFCNSFNITQDCYDLQHFQTTAGSRFAFHTSFRQLRSIHFNLFYNNLLLKNKNGCHRHTNVFIISHVSAQTSHRQVIREKYTNDDGIL